MSILIKVVILYAKPIKHNVMKSIILTDSQFEVVKQSIILKVRSLKEDVTYYRTKVEYFEKCENYQDALKWSRKLDSLFKELDGYYDLLFKLAQN